MQLAHDCQTHRKIELNLASEHTRPHQFYFYFLYKFIAFENLISNFNETKCQDQELKGYDEGSLSHDNLLQPFDAAKDVVFEPELYIFFFGNFESRDIFSYKQNVLRIAWNLYIKIEHIACDLKH